ncbi:unnamed protein product [Thlaspi arvense]|uniref:Uncharacterized protein n=1 Tax=Thlaspi arvense TaxID=13288 RepID=A0AAU9RL83_THLAR|nr:unnamed protein product [Thlaspi arvense]
MMYEAASAAAHDVETKAATLVASVDHHPVFGSGSGHDHGLSASVPLLGVNWKKRRMPRQRRSSSSFNLLSFPTMPPSSHVPTPLPARNTVMMTETRHKKAKIPFPKGTEEQ